MEGWESTGFHSKQTLHQVISLISSSSWLRVNKSMKSPGSVFSLNLTWVRSSPKLWQGHGQGWTAAPGVGHHHLELKVTHSRPAESSSRDGQCCWQLSMPGAKEVDKEHHQPVAHHFYNIVISISQWKSGSDRNCVLKVLYAPKEHEQETKMESWELHFTF